jgi:2-polyprenyl-3-methyl-5-hydroxy-6-metoxy-1,4-benzoquinol methylase
MSFDKKNFWENKIIGWEDKRYSFSDGKSGFMPNTDISFGSSLQFRLQKSTEILRPFLAEKKLLELGCGSGQLLNALSDSKIEKYIGIDLAPSAIDRAVEKFHSSTQLLPSEFIAGNFLDVDFPEYDVVVALGVLDWLAIDEIDTLFSKIKPKFFLFSISEKRSPVKRWFHSLYVFFAYGWKNEGYTPKYYEVDEIIRIARDYGYNDVKVFRDPRMSFGTFLYQLD